MNKPTSHKAQSANNTGTHTNKVPNHPVTDRETFLADIGEKLNKVESKMKSMRDESSRLAGDVKKRTNENLTKLDANYKELKGKLEDFKKSAKENWEDDKKYFEKSYHELATNIKKLFK